MGEVATGVSLVSLCVMITGAIFSILRNLSRDRSELSPFSIGPTLFRLGLVSFVPSFLVTLIILVYGGSAR